MSRKNLKLNFIALLACTALLFTALGCSGSPMGPDSDSSLSTDGPSHAVDRDSVNG